MIPFPFIQAGKYTFWVSTDATCAGAKLATATATRVGPTGKAGVDDIQFRQTGQPNIVNTDGTADLDLLILGQSVPPPAPTVQQKFPIPGVQLCIMSGDGAQVDIDVKVGQDSRSKGLGTAAATTTVKPFAGQNGCFDVPWLVNGGYTAMIARSGANATFGYCTANSTNAPNGTTTATIGKCAQVAFFPAEGSTLIGVQINGSIVTGADNHAVQVCVSAFTPGTARQPAGHADREHGERLQPERRGQPDAAHAHRLHRRVGGEGDDLRHHRAGAGRHGRRAVHLPDHDRDPERGVHHGDHHADGAGCNGH